MKRALSITLAIILMVSVLPFGLLDLSANAATSGNYTYTVNDSKATITDVNTSISGAVTIPSTLGGHPVVGIFDFAFANCTKLTSVTIPDSVATVGVDAFYACSALTSVTFGVGVTEIGDYAFEFCYQLTDIYYGGSFLDRSNIKIDAHNDILNNATWHYSSTSNVGYRFYDGTLTATVKSYDPKATFATVPKTVTANGKTYAVVGIDAFAFSKCINLTSISIPASVISIDRNAFDGCPATLTSIKVDSGNKYYHSSNNCLIETPTKTLVLGCKNSVIPTDKSVAAIADNAFKNCTGLMSVNIPDGVTEIGVNSFRGCTGLTSVAIPDGVLKIGDRAFYNCTSLGSVTLPDSVNRMGCDVFCGSAYCLNSDNWDNGVLYIGKHLVNAKVSLSGDYTVKPGTLTVADDAFHYCSDLTSITVPDSVLRIGDNAFEDCVSLTSVSLPNVPLSIGSRAFINTGYYKNSANWIGKSLFIGKHLIEVLDNYSGAYSIKSGTLSIAGDAFSFNRNLTSVTIPQSVTNIGDRAFKYCQNLTTVNIPDGVTGIGEEAFSFCITLTSITIPNDVKAIGKGAFSFDTGLTSVVIPKGLTYIGNKAFFAAIGIETLTIPYTVTHIGSYAFDECVNFKTVNFEGPASDWKAMGIGTDNQYLLNSEIILVKNITKVEIADKVAELTFEGDAPYGVTATYLHNSDQYHYGYYDGKGVVVGTDSQNNSFRLGADGNAGSDFGIKTSYANYTAETAEQYGAAFEMEPNSTYRLTYRFKICAGAYNYSNKINRNYLDVQAVLSQGYGSSNTRSGDLANDLKSHKYSGNRVNITAENGVERSNAAGFYALKEDTDWITATMDITTHSTVTYPQLNLRCDGIKGRWYLDYVKIEKIEGNVEYEVAGDTLTGYTSAIKDAVIPEKIGDRTVTAIEENAFASSKDITSVSIPDSVTEIMSGAFNGCSSLKTVYFGGTEAEWKAVTVGANNTYLQNVNIVYGSSYTDFELYDKLVELTFEGNAPYGITATYMHNSTQYKYGEYDGKGVVIGTNSGNNGVRIGVDGNAGSDFGIKTSYANYTAETAEQYGAAFEMEPNTTYRVTYRFKIGAGAYHRANGYDRNYLDVQAVLSQYYGETNKRVNIGNAIPNHKYTNNRVELTAENGVERTDAAGYYALKEDTEWITATLDIKTGDTVEYPQISIRCDGINGNWYLDRVSIEKVLGSAEYRTTDETAALLGYSSPFMDVVIPDDINGKTVSGIGIGAFADNQTITSVTVPDSVTEIGDSAFLGCSALETVYFKGTEEEWKAITVGKNNESLLNATVVFGHYFTEVDSWDKITDLDFEGDAPYGITATFTHNSTQYVYGTYDGKGVVIGTNSGNNGVRIGVDGNAGGTVGIKTSYGNYTAEMAEQYGAAFEMEPNSTYRITYRYKIGSGAYHYANGANKNYLDVQAVLSQYYGSSNKRVSVGSVISNYKYTNNRVSLTAENGVERTNATGFYALKEDTEWITAMLDIKTGETVEYPQITLRCDGIVGKWYLDYVTVEKVVGTVSYEIKDYEAALIGFDSPLKDVVIPESIDGRPVTVIGEGVFANNQNIISVTVPDSVAKIENFAFYNCASLDEIYHTGTKAVWSLITSGSGNSDLDDADFYHRWNGVKYDFDSSGNLNGSDAVHLLYNSLYGDSEYPVEQPSDFNSDGAVTEDDAIYLLYHVLFGEMYPLFP
ncbi:MAG: leucine-rich repeat protein [Clostridia bacterium]|nr:leucine-rich repeat protein [Clostridia bacterium]